MHEEWFDGSAHKTRGSQLPFTLMVLAERRRSGGGVSACLRRHQKPTIQAASSVGNFFAIFALAILKKVKQTAY